MKYSIDKSELMKMAWKLAWKEYYRRMQVQVIKAIAGDLPDGAKMPYTVRDCLSSGLRDAWELAKENIEREMENERVEREIKIVEDAEKCNENAPKRELVPTGKYIRGQKLYGFVITGLGRSFRPNADMFSLGISPDTDYVQYAYFN